MSPGPNTITVQLMDPTKASVLAPKLRNMLSAIIGHGIDYPDLERDARALLAECEAAMKK